ncbi:MAG: Xaa-Pro peptidase family protein [Pseudomonadota bacterium]
MDDAQAAPMIFEPWFSADEYGARLAKVQAALVARGHDGLIAFLPESVTWITGFFTRGYGTFQCAVVPASGAPLVVCRDVEAFYLEATSPTAAGIFWTDTDDPVAVAADAIRRRLGDAPALAIEMAAWPLSAARLAALRTALPRARFEDESHLVSTMRLIKSRAEIEWQRQAARAAEAGMSAAIESAGEGVSEREMAAEICAAMIRAGSDLPGPGVMSSGERAFHLHGGYSDRVLRRGDMVQIEVTPNVRHYHARFMRPLRIAPARDNDHRIVEELSVIQDEAISAVRPGVKASIPDAIYRDRVLSAGLRETYTNKTFYSVGLLLQPSGSEALEATPDARWSFKAGMTFHTYVLAQGFGISETILVTDDGTERLTQFPRQLFIC